MTPEFSDSSRVTAYIALGANLAQARQQVLSALNELADLPHTVLSMQSSLYQTAAVGGPPQADYINACARIETGLAARELLDQLLAIEARHGRTRTQLNAPRTLDLDLLLYANQVIDQAGLTVPHPRMHERAFVLIPLHEIAPQLTIPGRGSVVELLGRTGARGVTKIDAD
jgi:2-amino-4-hydroxy-6-hydroxymethyldihydropteridine diphosphokinase